MKRLLCCTLIIFVFVSCNKEELSKAIANSGPCGNCGGGYAAIDINLKPTNSYPAGSKLLIRHFTYSITDTTLRSNAVVFNSALPTKDTSLFIMSLVNYSSYHNWKITNANGDSLSGGKTNVLTPTLSSPRILFQINL